jgi:hypothetical protein
MLDCAAVSILRTMFSFNRGADIRAVIIVLRARNSLNARSARAPPVVVPMERILAAIKKDYEDCTYQSRVDAEREFEVLRNDFCFIWHSQI